MQVFCERLEVLGPIYRLLGQGVSDGDIAVKLRLSEVIVRNCIAWISHSLKLSNRAELVLHAFNAAQPSNPGVSLA